MKCFADESSDDLYRLRKKQSCAFNSMLCSLHNRLCQHFFRLSIIKTSKKIIELYTTIVSWKDKIIFNKDRANLLSLCVLWITLATIVNYQKKKYQRGMNETLSSHPNQCTFLTVLKFHLLLKEKEKIKRNFFTVLNVLGWFNFRILFYSIPQNYSDSIFRLIFTQFRLTFTRFTWKGHL